MQWYSDVCAGVSRHVLTCGLLLAARPLPTLVAAGVCGCGVVGGCGTSRPGVGEIIRGPVIFCTNCFSPLSWSGSNSILSLCVFRTWERCDWTEALALETEWVGPGRSIWTPIGWSLCIWGITFTAQLNHHICIHCCKSMLLIVCVCPRTQFWPLFSELFHTWPDPLVYSLFLLYVFSATDDACAVLHNTCICRGWIFFWHFRQCVIMISCMYWVYGYDFMSTWCNLKNSDVTDWKTLKKCNYRAHTSISLALRTALVATASLCLLRCSL